MLPSYFKLTSFRIINRYLRDTNVVMSLSHARVKLFGISFCAKMILIPKMQKNIFTYQSHRWLGRRRQYPIIGNHCSPK